jgi:hypothetical protein
MALIPIQLGHAASSANDTIAFLSYVSAEKIAFSARPSAFIGHEQSGSFCSDKIGR